MNINIYMLNSVNIIEKKLYKKHEDKLPTINTTLKVALLQLI